MVGGSEKWRLGFVFTRQEVGEEKMKPIHEFVKSTAERSEGRTANLSSSSSPRPEFTPDTRQSLVNFVLFVHFILN